MSDEPSLKGLICGKVVRDSALRQYGFNELCGQPRGHVGPCGRDYRARLRARTRNVRKVLSGTHEGVRT